MQKFNLEIATIHQLSSSQRKKMNIDSPCGTLESLYDRATDTKPITAVLGHPHPQYGGSMHDAVLQTAADVLLAHGANVLRFNFRGVGSSSGSFDNGIGETEDLLAASTWVKQETPENVLWWLGYSFGAAVVWRALQIKDLPVHHPQRTILIAPPIGVMDFAPAATDAIDPADIRDAIAGDQDDFVDLALLQSWPTVTAHVIPGADHFFANRHDLLADAIGQLLTG